MFTKLYNISFNMKSYLLTAWFDAASVGLTMVSDISIPMAEGSRRQMFRSTLTSCDRILATNTTTFVETCHQILVHISCSQDTSTSQVLLLLEQGRKVSFPFSVLMQQLCYVVCIIMTPELPMSKINCMLKH